MKMNCATAENERHFGGGLKRRGRAGWGGHSGQGELGDTGDKLSSLLHVPWINEPSEMCGLCSTAASQLCQGCQLGLGAAQPHPVLKQGTPGLGKHWHWERLLWFTWIRAALGKQSYGCCRLWEFQHGLMPSAEDLLPREQICLALVAFSLTASPPNLQPRSIQQRLGSVLA